MFYLIGCGLSNVKDLTLNAIDALNKCKYIFIEEYTSLIGFSIEDLKKLLNNDERIIKFADRVFVECGDEIIDNSKKSHVALLVKGDIFSATTHIDLFLRAKKENIPVKIIHNSSILTAVGDTGLSLYKLGRVASIPFNYKNIFTPFKVYLGNKAHNLHTLFLLDLDPINNKYMNFKDGLNCLIENGDGSVNLGIDVVVCAGLGTDSSVIKYGKIEDLLKSNINVYPQCFIIPSNLHFMEEEMLNNFR